MIAELGLVLRLHRAVESSGGAAKKPGTPPGVCGCGRKIRVSALVLAAGPILCGICDTHFTPPDDSDSDDGVEGGQVMVSRSRIEWTEVTWNPTTAAPLRWRAPRTVFVNSMSDLFHARVPTPFIARVFAVMAATPQHTYQILTKRAGRLSRLAPELPWPPNVWMGVSVEHLDVVHRVEHLRTVAAAVRFLSCEPLLGPLSGLDLDRIGWVIAGGESGPSARAMDPAWPTDLRDACLASGVPFFFKQWGGPTPKAGGRLLAGRTWDEMPPRLVG